MAESTHKKESQTYLPKARSDAEDFEDFYRNILARLHEHQTILESALEDLSSRTSLHEGNTHLARASYIPEKSFSDIIEAGKQVYLALTEVRIYSNNVTSSFPPASPAELYALRTLPPQAAVPSVKKSDIRSLFPPSGDDGCKETHLSALESWNAAVSTANMYRILFHEIANFGMILENCIDFMKSRSQEHSIGGQTFIELPSKALETLISVAPDMRALLDKAEQYSLTGETPEEKTVLNLNEPLSAILTMMQYEFQKSDIAVQEDYRADPLYFTGETLRTKQVFRNILLNKVRALNKVEQKSGRKITVETGKEEDNIYALLTDTGPTIQNDISRIFDLHYTAEKGGQGIGLWVCRRVIQERFGGKISARNIDPTGVEFLITLPAYKG